jgi:hypothetical protein
MAANKKLFVIGFILVYWLAKLMKMQGMKKLKHTKDFREIRLRGNSYFCTGLSRKAQG